MVWPQRSEPPRSGPDRRHRPPDRPDAHREARRGADARGGGRCPVPRLLAAPAELKAELVAHPDPDRWGPDVVASMMLFQPVVDGDVLPGHPLERVTAGSADHVDLMVGTNTDDWRLFLAITGALAEVTEDVPSGPVDRYGYLTAAAYGLPLETALPAYRPLPRGDPRRPPRGRPDGLVDANPRRSAWPTPTSPATEPRAPTCTSSPGPPPASAPSTAWRCRSCSTPPGPTRRCSVRCWGTLPPLGVDRLRDGREPRLARLRAHPEKHHAAGQPSLRRARPERPWERSLWAGAR